jgi:lipid-binding SYLF domain-containing protein
LVPLSSAQLVSGQIKHAEAVAFLTSGRAGVVMTGQIGTGLVIARLPDGSWSAPSAIGYLGGGFGMQMGADLTDYVIILNRHSLGSFIGEPRRARNTPAKPSL